MTDTPPVWRRNEIESPCVKICVVHPEARICIGCHRAPDEIAMRSRLTPEERREVMETLRSRADRLPKRRGGRSARIKRGLA